MINETPHTLNRAATAVVQSWHQLEKAREEVRLALEILSRPEVDSAGEHAGVIQRLQGYLAGLEALERDGRQAWEPG